MHAQQEIRIDQHAFERELDAGVERAAVAPAGLEELDQRLAIRWRDGAPIGEPRHPREDSARARRVGRRLRLADEDLAPARRLRRHAVHAMRSADVDRADRRVAHVDLIVGEDAAALQRLRQSLRFPHLAHERHADDARARRHRHAHLEARIAGQLHVGFPLGRAGEARLAVAGVARRRRRARRLAADGESLDELAVEPDVELLRPAHAHQVVLILAAQPDRDQILAIDRKLVANRDAAARTERQVFILPIVLHDVQRNLEGLERGARRWQAGRQPRHLSRRGEIALEMRRRNGEDVGEIVEAAVGGLITGQQRLHVERLRIEREQIADRVAVLRAIQAMDGADPPGFGFAVHARSMSASIQLAIDCAVASSGRGRPAGGIEPARSRAITRSQSSGLVCGDVTSAVSSVRPAVLSRWLWQVTQ